MSRGARRGRRAVRRRTRARTEWQAIGGGCEAGGGTTPGMCDEARNAPARRRTGWGETEDDGDEERHWTVGSRWRRMVIMRRMSWRWEPKCIFKTHAVYTPRTSGA